MPVLSPSSSHLLVIDMQARLLAAIQEGEAVVAEVRRLVAAAALMGVPVLATEQNPAKLGGTLPEIPLGDARVVDKMTFDCVRTPGFLELLPPDRDIVVVGCETHVCVLQTVLGLIDAGRRVAVVRDGCGSRRFANRDAGLERMSRHGADIVTAEMVVFEWLGSAEHPRFREAIALVK